LVGNRICIKKSTVSEEKKELDTKNRKKRKPHRKNSQKVIYDFFDSIAATINLLIFAIGLRLHETVRVKKALLNNRIFSIFANLNLNMKITELYESS
jgi:ABC-type microcin C transport system duplicated ATPase subunit YejF